MGKDITPGIYRGRAIRGTAQYGLSEKNEPQVALDFAIPSLDHIVTIAMSMHPNALPYTIQRLRACGWKGKIVTEIDEIEAEEVDIQLFYETYNGRMRMKAEVMTAGGTFKLDKPMNAQEQERLASEVLRHLEAQDRQMQSEARDPSPSARRR